MCRSGKIPVVMGAGMIRLDPLVLWLYCGCTVVVLWLYCGCTVVVLWFYCGCTVVVLWLYCGCTVVVLWSLSHRVHQVVQCWTGASFLIDAGGVWREDAVL